MTTEDISVASDQPGVEQRMAKEFRCECGNNTWTIFQIVGQKHFHFHCEQCHEVYCPHGGDCEQGD